MSFKFSVISIPGIVISTDSCINIDCLISTINKILVSEVKNLYTLLTDSFGKPSLNSSKEECATIFIVRTCLLFTEIKLGEKDSKMMFIL